MNTTQCLWPGLKPRPLDPESSALTRGMLDQIFDCLNSSLVYELGKGALGIVEPQYGPWAEHAGTHGNYESGNHLALSHWQSQWRYLPPRVLSALPMEVREVREEKHSTGMNGTQSKLHVCTQLATKTHKPCKTLYKTPPNIITPRDCWPVLAQLKHCLNHI